MTCEFCVAEIILVCVELHYGYPGCARINYALLIGHDKLYAGPILKIFELICS